MGVASEDPIFVEEEIPRHCRNCGHDFAPCIGERQAIEKIDNNVRRKDVENNQEAVAEHADVLPLGGPEGKRPLSEEIKDQTRKESYWRGNP